MSEPKKVCKYWDYDAFMHSIAHIIGTLAPFIIVLIVCLFSELGQFWGFLKEGDFCIFSGAILTPAAYTFHAYKPKKVTSTTSRYQRIAANLWPISIFLIGVSSILFLLIYIHSIDCDFKIYPNAIIIVSIIFLIASFIIYYISRYIHREIEFDEHEMGERSFNDLETDYNNAQS